MGGQLVPLRQLGWAFLLAWVFCVFYTNAAGGISDGATGAATLASTLLYDALPLASSVIALAAIVLAEPRFGAPTNSRRLAIAAPLLTAAGTPLMFAALPDPAAGAALFFLGAVATGIGSALLWAMWGEYYAVIPCESAELLAPVSAVSAALLTIAVSSMSGWVAVAAATVFPLLSGACFRLVWTRDAAAKADGLARAARVASDSERRGPLAGLGRTGFGILVVFAIVSVAGMLFLGRVEGIVLQGILLLDTGMMALVAVMAVSGPRRIALSFLYRWMCPVLVIGFAAVILLGAEGGLAAVAASLGGRFIFCLIAQVYFANYAAAGRATPAQASGLGWLFVHAGDFLGMLLWLAIAPLASETPAGAAQISTIAIVALVVVTMLMTGERSNFLRAPDAPLPTEQAPPAAVAASPAAASSPAVAAAAATTDETVTTGGPDPAAEAASEARPVTRETRVADLAAACGLTPREREVFALLAQGRSIPYIRDELIVSRDTAATHAKHIYAKLGVHSRQELIDLVHRNDSDARKP